MTVPGRILRLVRDLDGLGRRARRGHADAQEAREANHDLGQFRQIAQNTADVAKQNLSEVRGFLPEFRSLVVAVICMRVMPRLRHSREFLRLVRK